MCMMFSVAIVTFLQGCGYEFCWMCMGAWSEHGSTSGGYYKCNRYEEQKASGSLPAHELTRQEAKNELEKYMHYFSRFQNHESSRKACEKSLKEIEMKMERLQEEKVGQADSSCFVYLLFPYRVTS